MAPEDIGPSIPVEVGQSLDVPVSSDAVVRIGGFGEAGLLARPDGKTSIVVPPQYITAAIAVEIGYAFDLPAGDDRRVIIGTLGKTRSG